MPQVFPNLPFDLDRDFVRVGFVAEQPMVIAVAPSLGVNSLQDLITLAKKRPDEILYAANARGTLPHLTAERFRSQSGIELHDSFRMPVPRLDCRTWWADASR